MAFLLCMNVRIEFRKYSEKLLIMVEMHSEDKLEVARLFSILMMNTLKVYGLMYIICQIA